jgi:hypothetical protein
MKFDPVPHGEAFWGDPRARLVMLDVPIGFANGHSANGIERYVAA